MGPMDRSLRNDGNKWQLARPLTLLIFGSMRDIRCLKFVLPGRLGQSSPTSLKTLRTNIPNAPTRSAPDIEKKAKVHQIRRVRVSIGRAFNYAKFRNPMIISVPDIRCRKSVLLKK